MVGEIDYYKNLFSHLHTAKIKGVSAPHKAVLMLSIIELIEDGPIYSSRIELSDVLVSKFSDIWDRYSEVTRNFSKDIGKPFFHMQHEPFWNLLEADEEFDMVSESLWLPKAEKTLPVKSGYSVNKLRQFFPYAVIDCQLLELLQNKEEREILSTILVQNYLTAIHPSKLIMPNLSDLLLAVPLLAIVA